MRRSIEETAACDPFTSAITIGLKVPSFRPSDPEIWFVQFEEQETSKLKNSSMTILSLPYPLNSLRRLETSS